MQGSGERAASDVLFGRLCARVAAAVEHELPARVCLRARRRRLRDLRHRHASAPQEDHASPLRTADAGDSLIDRERRDSQTAQVVVGSGSHVAGRGRRRFLAGEHAHVVHSVSSDCDARIGGEKTTYCYNVNLITANTAPCGSMRTLKRPTWSISRHETRAVPPREVALSVAASQSSTAK